MPWLKVDRDEFVRQYPHLAEFQDFLDEFNRETERGAALAAGVLLDDMLARIIRAFLMDNTGTKKLLEGANAPLGTFESRINACLAMGLISQAEYDEAQLVRKVRNEFAHKLKMSFNNPKVRGLCSTLRLSIPITGKEENPARAQFSSASIVLILNLTNREEYVRQRRLKFQEWPR